MVVLTAAYVAFLGASAISVGMTATPQVEHSDRRGQAYADFVLASYDANGDGALTQIEFDATGKANFTDIDRNADGAASSAEIADWYVSYLAR